ncbi:endonuclease-reverse transcriptase [Plakobranchus ocellatus]|uniref:Endonuclease-reverse transcriptase n=1 Tax=Plakobranchus ocellatus TaxID=259542 RepID=A0AAV4C6T3_9GAST|nr:endonuclease-reverse transcriptase [Plakobranchus ocellatus]
MIKENGESTTDRDEIITICQTFYRKLYEQTTTDQPTTLTSSPDKGEIPPFLEEEVKESLDEMRKKTTPENDGITNDVMKIGGPQVIKDMTKVFNEVLKRATARIHIDNQISEAFEIQRGVRQGDPISPKLFITVIEQVFKEADIKYGINIDGEYLRDLRFADDVALCTEKEEELVSW